MRHTKKFYLLPEEIFDETFAQNDASPVGLVKKRMRHIETDDTLNEGEKATRYQQEYKRLNKLAKDDADHPVNVHLKNPQDVVDLLQKQEQPPPKKDPIKTPKRKTKRAKTPEPTAIDEFDEDEWDDAVAKSPPKLRPKKGTAPEGQIQNYTLTTQKVMEYIMQNIKDLGVSSDRKVLRADGQVYKTSSVDDIVAHLLNRDRKSQFKNFPAGYKEFVEKAKLHPFLNTYLFPEKPHQFGSGALTSFKINKKNPGHQKLIFKFKPQLW